MQGYYTYPAESSRAVSRQCSSAPAVPNSEPREDAVQQYWDEASASYASLQQNEYAYSESYAPPHLAYSHSHSHSHSQPASLDTLMDTDVDMDGDVDSSSPVSSMYSSLSDAEYPYPYTPSTANAEVVAYPSQYSHSHPASDHDGVSISTSYAQNSDATWASEESYRATRPKAPVTDAGYALKESHSQYADTSASASAFYDQSGIYVYQDGAYHLVHPHNPPPLAPEYPHHYYYYYDSSQSGSQALSSTDPSSQASWHAQAHATATPSTLADAHSSVTSHSNSNPNPMHDPLPLHQPRPTRRFNYQMMNDIAASLEASLASGHRQARRH